MWTYFILVILGVIIGILMSILNVLLFSKQSRNINKAVSKLTQKQATVVDLTEVDLGDKEKDKIEAEKKVSNPNSTNITTTSTTSTENRPNIISFVTHVKSFNKTDEEFVSIDVKPIQNNNIAIKTIKPEPDLKRPSNPPSGEKHKYSEKYASSI